MKRTKQIILRVNEAEYAILHKKKTSATMARFLRDLALGADDKNEQITHKIPPEVVRILAGVSNNLNQIARNVNIASKYGEMNKLDAVMILTEITATEREIKGLYKLIEGESNQ